MFNVKTSRWPVWKAAVYWVSLVMSFMASFVLSFFPLDVLDGIWDLIESVSEGFLTYSFFCFVISAILFDTPEISSFIKRCFCESSSLIHHRS